MKPRVLGQCSTKLDAARGKELLHSGYFALSLLLIFCLGAFVSIGAVRWYETESTWTVLSETRRSSRQRVAPLRVLQAFLISFLLWGFCFLRGSQLV